MSLRQHSNSNHRVPCHIEKETLTQLARPASKTTQFQQLMGLVTGVISNLEVACFESISKLGFVAQGLSLSSHYSDTERKNQLIQYTWK